MKTIFHHICLFLLVAAVAASSFPGLNPADVNHDQSVNLQDLVLCARNIMDTATVSGDFVMRFHNFYTAARVVAGFKHIIKKDRGTNFSSTGNQAYLPPLPAWTPRLCSGSLIVPNPPDSLKVFYPPELRPPCLPA
ncbi:MAG: hypothetical protein GXP53_01770 [Deltaproteobacteria bacterium]|nr:hypothetical protein [Deltaproteobacteria bacterium]